MIVSIADSSVRSRKEDRTALDSVRYRNRVRGMLNEAKAHGFGIDDNIRHRRLKIVLRTILLEARLHIPPNRYTAYVHWLQRQSGVAGSILSVGQGFVFQNIYAPPVDLLTELAWIAARLSAAAQTINSHLRYQREISAAFLRGDSERVMILCDEVDYELGESHWLFGIRTAALQRFKGVQEQKAYLSSVRMRSKRGITAVFAHYTSVRNESSVALPWFKSDVRSRQFSKQHPEIRRYLCFVLLGDLPQTFAHIADVLRIEQAHTDVDLYETALHILQQLARRILDAETRKAILEAVTVLKPIDDPRIEKLLCAFRRSMGNGPGLPRSREDVIEGIIRGSVSKPIDAVAITTSDPAAMLWNALAANGNSFKDIPMSEGLKPYDVLETKLANLWLRGDGHAATASELAKEALNLRGLPVGAFLQEVCNAFSHPAALDFPIRLANASLNSNVSGGLDRIFSNGHAKLSTPADDVIGDYADWLVGRTDNVDASALAKGIGSLRTLVARGEFELANRILEQMLNSSLPILINWGRVAALEVYQANSDRGSALQLIGRWAITRRDSSADLPIDEALQGFTDADIISHGHLVTTPIALDQWRRIRDDDRKQTLLRLSFNHFMKAAGFRVPSELPIALMQDDLPGYIYFLENICIPPLMDMNAAFKSSVELSEERRNVCALLRSINPANSAAYDEEIVSITQSLSIREGLRTVDGSRIHVDEAALARVVHEELSGNFARYLSLVQAGVGVAEDYDVVLKNLIKTEGYAQGLTIPENEADELLVSIVLRIRQLFLTNGVYGLDGYVSKRIRHGSLIGHLRGPVERRKLITQRIGDAQIYEPNLHWSVKIAEKEQVSRSRFLKALEDFSKTFDRELIQLKDEKLQIRDEKHPEGVLTFPVIAPALHVIRSALKADPTMDGLVRATVGIFWGLLQPALDEAQALVRDRFKGRVADMFSRLLAATSPCINTEPFFAEFVAAVRSASEETQAQIASVSAWFEKSGISTAKRTYSLAEVIDIGTVSAQHAFSSFQPSVTKICDEAVMMSSASLQVVADVLLIALGNVCTHSGMGQSPSIQVTARQHSSGDALVFNIRNKVADGLRTSDVETNLEALRSRISKKEFDGYVSSEGNSGLLKLACTVYQFPIGELKFGFLDDHEFEVEMVLSFIPHEEAV
jgi:hypothetical protein